MQKIVEDHEVVRLETPVPGNHILYLRAPVDIPEILPGNFAEIQVPDAADVFLRRPFSILDVDYEQRIISFYIKVIGKGTRKLGELRAGQKVNVIYPLGNAYTIDEGIGSALMVGGGSGIAPFILLGRELKRKNIRATFLLGARTAKDILLTDAFANYGEVLVTTEDGSMGEKGLVTQHSVFQDENFKFDKVFTYGPDPMMKAVGRIAQERKVACEVSLENMMACGFGVCLCCVTATREGNKRVCMEGPVFNVNYLSW
jgi:dihydroorotate dehydrogenase electron transfer subunit